MASILSAGTTSGTALNMSGDTSGVLQLASNNGTTAVTIDTSQNVGIGTSSPTTKAQVSTATGGSTSGLSVVASGNMLNIFGSSSTNAGVILDATNGTVGSATAVPTIFRYGGTESMRIDSSGNVLVGATSVGTTSAKFLVSANANTYNILTVQDTSSTYGSGNYFAIFYNNSSASAGTISHPTATTVSYNTSSDSRLKTNIVDAPSVLNKVLNAKVRSFDWKEDNHHVEYGFVAQELYEQLPEAVGKGDDAPELSNPKNMWQVEYGRLTPMLVKAIQELKAINDTQAETLTQQTEAINALTARVVALESRGTV